MGFLSGIGRAIHSPDFGMRLQAAFAAANGDTGAIARMHAQQIQNAELALRQEAARRAEEDAANQVWGMKQSGHFDNAAIAAMNPEDRSHAMAGFVAPYDQAPGNRRVFPGANGQSDNIVTAPTTDQQNAAFYESQQPGAGAAYVNRQAYGPPIPIQQGGGVVQFGPEGPHYAVQPDGMGPQPAPGAPPQAGGTARNNPGGLRYPGSPQFRSFPTQQAGISAQEGQLGRYMGRGINSIQSIVETYAPRRSRGGDNTDEQVNNYISYVARRLGVDPSQPLSAADIPRVGQAMREVETGRRPGANAPVLGRAAQGGGGNPAMLRAQAARAIQQGRDPAQVRARLRQMGVSDAGL